MELLQIGNYFIAYQRAGNDKNGNPIFLINVFQQYGGQKWYNINYADKGKHGKRLDKNGNIRMQSYNIEADVKYMIESLN